MLKIVPDPDTFAKSSMTELQKAFSAEVDSRTENGDFATRERAARALLGYGAAPPTFPEYAGPQQRSPGPDALTHFSNRAPQ